MTDYNQFQPFVRCLDISALWISKEQVDVAIQYLDDHMAKCIGQQDSQWSTFYQFHAYISVGEISLHLAHLRFSLWSNHQIRQVHTIRHITCHKSSSSPCDYKDWLTLNACSMGYGWITTLHHLRGLAWRGGWGTKWTLRKYTFYFFFALTSAGAASTEISFRFSKRLSELRKTRLFELATVFAMSRAASILRKVMNDGLLAIASPMSFALVASPWRCKNNTYHSWP